MRNAFCVVVALASIASANAFAADEGGLPGRGRVTLSPGWNIAPDGPFNANSAYHLGEAPKPSAGAPTLWASFGYGASEVIEVSIDLFGAFATLQYANRAALQKVDYGGAAAVHYVGDFELAGLKLEPELELAVMGLLVNLNGGDMTPTESFLPGYLFGAGISTHVGEAYAVGLEYRYLYGRGRAPVEVHGSINGGGHFLLLSLSYFLPGEAPHQVNMSGSM